MAFKGSTANGRSAHEVSISYNAPWLHISLAAFAVLTVLRLADVFAVSWLWVFAPLWIPAAVIWGGLVLFFTGIFGVKVN